MSAFAPEWLALREPADTRARAPALVESLRLATAGSGARHVVDLGAGTGAALRYLAPRLGGAQRWRLVDADARVLDAARGAIGEWARARGARVEPSAAGMRVEDPEFACRIELVEADLARGFEHVAWSDGTIVCASALLDLVSAGWLAALVGACAAARSAAWLTLTYDGRIALEPSAALDAHVHAAFDRDQRRDKGFGAALGPDAARRAAEAFALAGFTVQGASSEWVLGPGSAALARALVDGYGRVARTAGAGSADELAGWQHERTRQIDTGALTLRVGHTDLLALPAA